MLYSIELLRMIAVCLITNSHLDGVYPINISWGGAPGVALFFTVSGYVLARGVEKASFLKWYFKKLIRIYIPLWIVNVVTVLIGFRQGSIGLFLMPIFTNLWYVPVITILYIFYFFYIKYLKKYQKFICGVILVSYFILYLSMYRNEFFVEPVIGFRILYGALSMVIGAEVYYASANIQKMKNSIVFLIGGGMSCVAFLCIKLLIPRCELFMRLQFLTQLFSVLFATFMIIFGIQHEEKFMTVTRSKIWGTIRYISNHSLEIYLLQFPVIHYLKDIVFPINFLFIILATAVFSSVVHRLSGEIFKMLKI